MGLSDHVPRPIRVCHSPSAVLGILRDARKRAVAGDATVYAIRPSVKVAEIDLTVRISRGRDRCTATAAPCRAAAIARAMTSGRVAPIESVILAGRRCRYS